LLKNFDYAHETHKAYLVLAIEVLIGDFVMFGVEDQLNQS